MYPEEETESQTQQLGNQAKGIDLKHSFQIEYAMFFNHFTSSKYHQSHFGTGLCDHRLMPVSTWGKRKGISSGVWISSSSSSRASLFLFSYTPDSLLVLLISLNGKVHEEHFISKLHLSWPQISSDTVKGSRVVLASYKDSFGQTQKFAMRFLDSSQAELFIDSLKDSMKYVEIVGLPSSNCLSEVPCDEVHYSAVTESNPVHAAGADTLLVQPSGVHATKCAFIGETSGPEGSIRKIIPAGFSVSERNTGRNLLPSLTDFVDTICNRNGQGQKFVNRIDTISELKGVPACKIRVAGTTNIMVRVEEDTGSTTFLGQRHSLGDNTPLPNSNAGKKKKKTGKTYGGEPEKEPAKERLVLGTSQPDPKKQGKTNLPLEKEDIPSPRNTPAAKKRLEDQKLAKIEAELKKQGDDSDQQQRMRRYVLEETRRRCLLGQPDPTEHELEDLRRKRSSQNPIPSQEEAGEVESPRGQNYQEAEGYENPHEERSNATRDTIFWNAFNERYPALDMALEEFDVVYRRKNTREHHDPPECRDHRRRTGEPPRRTNGHNRLESNWNQRSPRRDEYRPGYKPHQGHNNIEGNYNQGYHHRPRYSPPRHQQYNRHRENPPYFQGDQQGARDQNILIREEMRKIIGIGLDRRDTDVSQWLQGYVQVMRISNATMNFMAKALPSYLAGQGQYESLTDFHKRFIQETLQVDNIDDRDVRNGFIQGLNPFGKSSMLRVKLSTKPPKNAQEMWVIVENHIQREHTLKRSQEFFVSVGLRDKPKIPMENKLALTKMDRQLTPLTKLRREILQIHKDELPVPKPLAPNPNRSTEQYCGYHKDHGHDTEDCRELKREIENGVKSG
ncbi:OLC1v1013194C1 [Oldenlandia corymbosa var. corymbosa]|uniref:OLC1v1013194C1 n=1 Tax=Oldenlandia corymbosa var. corymbosa TaxID=529605 RepID=A0AAV1DXQ6_OLDCO|nr:OLC1v1013194C1 [Oldenlandia corymbosa var. corymbosa]